MIPIYVKDIKQALQNNCYFTALSLALALPDICGCVESPNKSVSERYITWYDRYIGQSLSEDNKVDDDQNPWLSGELVYNLRNTFLHQGMPTVNSSKVKEEANKIDHFILMLGDGSVFNTLAINTELHDKTFSHKMIVVDVSFLCNAICDCAQWYYENNKTGFSFDFGMISQNDLIKALEQEPKEDYRESMKKVFNKKLEKENEHYRFI